MRHINLRKCYFSVYKSWRRKSGGGVLVDDFKGHSTDVVKEYVKSFKSGDETDDDEDRYELIDFHIMGGGITPKAQPLDLFLGKIMKDFYRDLYDTYMVNAPANPLTGHPFIPSRQLCATWVVSAWERVPEALVKKAWVIGNYVPFDKLQNKGGNGTMTREITNYDENKIIDAIMQVENHEDFLQHYLAADNVYADSEFCDSNLID